MSTDATTAPSMTGALQEGRYIGGSKLAPPRWRPQEGRNVVDAATTGSREPELGFHQEESDVLQLKGGEATSTPPRR